MITGAIGIFLVVIGIILSSNGDWGSAAVAWVLAAIAVFAGMVSRDDDRAHNNFVRYWADGGKSERRQREREERSREENAREERERKKREADEKAERLIKKMQKENVANEPEAVTVRCDGCGKAARVIRNVTYPNGANYTEYQCPFCGERKLKKI